MSYRLPIVFSALAVTAFTAATTVEFDAVIEGEISVTSDQFSYLRGGHLEAIAEEAEMRADMESDYHFRYKDGDYTNIYDAVDRERSTKTRVIPVETLDGFYKVRLTASLAEDFVNAKEGDRVTASVSGTLYEHFQNYIAAQESHPFNTPTVDAETFEAS